MTLREIFNSILDHPIEPWAIVIGVVIAIVVCGFMWRNE